MNVTAENNFYGANRAIQYDATSAPPIVNEWTATGAPKHVYARLAAGAIANVTGELALPINLSQTLRQPGGDGFAGSCGVKIAF